MDIARYSTEANDYEWAESEGARNALQRMSAMAHVRWKAIYEVSLNRGNSLSAGSTVIGIPYSSTKEINKYVGIDVSFYSFLTATENPYSVLYTENIGKPPYHGVNCACYYGTVCSASVSFALGFSISQPTFFFPYLDGVERLDNQDITNLKACDIMQSFNNDSPGHVLMIYRLDKDKSGNISDVVIFEAGSTMARLSRMTSKDFKDRIIKDNLIAFRYKYLDTVSQYDFSDRVIVNENETSLNRKNLPLCPNRGDRSVYRAGETVEIDVFDSSYDQIVISNSIKEYVFHAQEGINLFNNLVPGYYKAYLRSGIRTSDAVEFVLAKPYVKLSKEEKLHIEFDCDYGVPSYCVLCSESGSVKSIYVLNPDDISKGFIDIDSIEGNHLYCKVVFQTQFGTVINNPIPIM